MVEHQTKVYRKERKKHRKRVTAMLSGSLGGVAKAKGAEQRMRKASLHATVTSPTMLDRKFRPVGGGAGGGGAGSSDEEGGEEGKAAPAPAAAADKSNAPVEAAADVAANEAIELSAGGVAALRAEVAALGHEVKDVFHKLHLELLSHRELGRQ